MDGQIDIAVVFNQPSRPAVISTPFAWENMHLIGRVIPGEPHASIEARQLTGLAMVMPSRKQSFRNVIEHHIQQHGGKLDVRIEIDAGHQLIKLISSGRFYSILSPGSVAHEISTGQLQARPLAQPLERSICLAHRRLSHQTVAMRCVIDELLSEARMLIEAGVWEARMEAIPE